MILNGYYVKLCFAPIVMSIAMKSGFRGLATLELVVNVGELKTATNNCGIARSPCDSTTALLLLSPTSEQSE